MAKRRKKQEEEHENMERWLVSYADFITLLFAFFVTMYAISRVDEKKFGSMVESMQRALGSVMVFQSVQHDTGAFDRYNHPIQVKFLPQDSPALLGQGQERLAKVLEEIQKKIKEVTEQQDKGAGSGEARLDQLKFILDKRGLVLRFSEKFFFDSGDASIHPGVIPILRVLAESLAKIPNQIRIEGHTDSVPISTPRFPSNWELSTARATSIIHYFLTESRFDPNRLSAAGYGEFRPIAPNKTEEGRMQNRRVDIVILNNKEMETEPGTEEARPPASST